VITATSSPAGGYNSPLGSSRAAATNRWLPTAAATHLYQPRPRAVSTSCRCQPLPAMATRVLLKRRPPLPAVATRVLLQEALLEQSDVASVAHPKRSCHGSQAVGAAEAQDIALHGRGWPRRGAALLGRLIVAVGRLTGAVTSRREAISRGAAGGRGAVGRDATLGRRRGLGRPFRRLASRRLAARRPAMWTDVWASLRTRGGRWQSL